MVLSRQRLALCLAEEVRP
jgi:hypothetical protein